MTPKQHKISYALNGKLFISRTDYTKPVLGNHVCLDGKFYRQTRIIKRVSGDYFVDVELIL